ncbi:MAG: hypothetical protein OIF40_08405, partial [Mangrovicoccus sp.]|nr:hypothetical protein [Mangrovicoccus sp.]
MKHKEISVTLEAQDPAIGYSAPALQRPARPRAANLQVVSAPAEENRTDNLDGETVDMPNMAALEATRPLAGRKVLILVENLPLPFDRRVWHECRTLTAAGAQVSVICPKGKGYEAPYEEIDGVHIYRHGLPLDASGALGYLMEYGAALFHETR